MEASAIITRPAGRATPVTWLPERIARAGDRWLYLAILLAALAIRTPTLGDLNYHIDEQFYLLVGDRMRAGLLPYVDIWDRKPFGLFLLYRALASVGDGSIIAVQIAAGLSAAATAMLVAAIARRWVAGLPALLAALAYLAGLEALAGGGGQSPVFYNLPMAAMAWGVFRAGDVVAAGGARTLARFRRYALPVVLCGGVALTIKQTSLAECLFLGAVLVVQLRRLALRPAVIVREAALLALLGALPSLLCLGVFAARGDGAAYLFATLFSSFGRAPMAGGERLAHALYLAPRIAPLLSLAIAGALLLRTQATRRGDAVILAGWIGAAIAGFAMVPNFYDHYALPLLPSLCVAAALVFARRPLGPVIAALTIALALLLAGWPATGRVHASNTAIAQATRLVTAHGGSRALYVFDGPVQLYTLARAPLPTRWVFPEHLSTAEEHAAIGTDATAELARILRTAPAVIVAADTPGPRHPDPAAWRMLHAALARDYARVGGVMLPDVGSTRVIGVYARRR